MIISIIYAVICNNEKSGPLLTTICGYTVMITLNGFLVFSACYIKSGISVFTIIWYGDSLLLFAASVYLHGQANRVFPVIDIMLNIK